MNYTAIAKLLSLQLKFMVVREIVIKYSILAILYCIQSGISDAHIQGDLRIQSLISIFHKY